MPTSIGKKLKELRLRRGLSLEEVTEKINIEYGTSLNKGMLSKWENGLSEPRLDTTRILALFYGVSLDYLIGLTDEIETLAAHHDGEDWTEEELKKIEEFKAFIRSQRKRK